MEFCCTHLYKKCTCLYKIKLKRVAEIKSEFEKGKKENKDFVNKGEINYNLDPNVKKMVMFFESWMLNKNKIF